MFMSMFVISSADYVRLTIGNLNATVLLGYRA